MRLIKKGLVTLSGQDHMIDLKHISATRIPMATKLDRMVTDLN